MKMAYVALLAVIAGLVLYAVAVNYVLDPQAEEFLGRKTKLKRELDPPVWLTVKNVHVAAACLAMAAGAANFSTRLRVRSRTLHKAVGYGYAAAVFIVVVSSGYMAPYATGGKAASVAFNLMNLIWPFATGWAILQIRKKRLREHQRWMVRSYAFCFTNVLIHLLAYALHRGLGLDYAASYTGAVYATIVIVLAAAELVIRKGLKL